jgi:hypothetical protein
MHERKKQISWIDMSAHDIAEAVMELPEAERLELARQLSSVLLLSARASTKVKRRSKG